MTKHWGTIMVGIGIGDEILLILNYLTHNYLSLLIIASALAVSYCFLGWRLFHR